MMEGEERGSQRREEEGRGGEGRGGIMTKGMMLKLLNDAHRLYLSVRGYERIVKKKRLKLVKIEKCELVNCENRYSFVVRDLLI